MMPGKSEDKLYRRLLLVMAVLPLLMPVAACRQEASSGFQGYVEGEYLYLAPARAGRLDALLVHRGERVSAGARLFQLEVEEDVRTLEAKEAALAQAKAVLADMQTGQRAAELAVAQARLAQAQTEAGRTAALLQRLHRLAKNGGVSQRDLDDSRAAAHSAAERVQELEQQLAVATLPERPHRIAAQEAAVAAAEAEVAQARWELARKGGQAPAAGLVVDTLFRKGEWVSAGSPVVQLLPPEAVKFRFFVPETRLGSLRLGTALHCLVDGRPEPVAAQVVWIAPEAEYTPPVIYSNETRSKLVFMVEARPDEPALAGRLHPGQPVQVLLQ